MKEEYKSKKGKNTNQKNIFQAVFKLKSKIDLQQFISGTSNEQTYQKRVADLGVI